MINDFFDVKQVLDRPGLSGELVANTYYKRV